MLDNNDFRYARKWLEKKEVPAVWDEDVKEANEKQEKKKDNKKK